MYCWMLSQILWEVADKQTPKYSSRLFNEVSELLKYITQMLKGHLKKNNYSLFNIRL